MSLQMSSKKKELTIEALLDNLETVQSFVEQVLEEADCPIKTLMQISVAVEEIFVNIAQYAYVPGNGMATVAVELSDEKDAVILRFTDQGIPYDPLAREDPDITAPAADRQIGGLGIYMTKQLMDEIEYEYSSGKNILTMKKLF